MAPSEVRVRAREPQDVEAIAEIFACPGVVAGTLQLPFRSVAERRERLAQPAANVHSLVAELDGRVVGNLLARGDQLEASALRQLRNGRPRRLSGTWRGQCAGGGDDRPG